MTHLELILDNGRRPFPLKGEMHFLFSKTFKIMQGGCRKKLYPIEKLNFQDTRYYNQKKPRCHAN